MYGLRILRRTICGKLFLPFRKTSAKNTFFRLFTIFPKALKRFFHRFSTEVSGVSAVAFVDSGDLFFERLYLKLEVLIHYELAVYRFNGRDYR